MRKYLSILILVAFISVASATTISEEDMKIDLEDNSIRAEIDVELLTSSDFTYISASKVENLNTTIDGQPIQCQTSDLALGSEIKCPVDVKENFTIVMTYESGDMVSKRNDVKIFRYRHPIYRPTEQYDLEVVLPTGTALLENDNTSQQVISPQNYETSSNGRRISVNWNLKPRLGETSSFFVLYQDFSQQNQPGFNYTILQQIGVAVVVLLILLASVIQYKRRDLSEKYEELSEDQRKVLELLKENDGEYLQKDLVKELDYSKAKVSGIVSELVEEEVIKKKKEGRSNKLTIPRKFKY